MHSSPSWWDCNHVRLRFYLEDFSDTIEYRISRLSFTVPLQPVYKDLEGLTYEFRDRRTTWALDGNDKGSGTMEVVDMVDLE